MYLLLVLATLWYIYLYSTVVMVHCELRSFPHSGTCPHAAGASTILESGDGYYVSFILLDFVIRFSGDRILWPREWPFSFFLFLFLFFLVGGIRNMRRKGLSLRINILGSLFQASSRVWAPAYIAPSIYSWPLAQLSTALSPFSSAIL